MSNYMPRHDFSLACAINANETAQVASLAGDGGYIISPTHIISKALGHLTKIVGVTGTNKTVSTRIIDAMMLRCVVPNDEVLAQPVVSWVVGPKRWARLFQDLDKDGGLRDDKFASAAEFAAYLHEEARKLTYEQRKIDLDDIINIHVPAVAAAAANDGTAWLEALSGEQASHAKLID